MKTFLVLGATSAIAQNVAMRAASEGWGLILVGRNEEKLKSITGDLQIRFGGQVSMHVADLADTHANSALLKTIYEQHPTIDAVLIAHGMLPDQARAEQDGEYAKQAMIANLSSPLSLLATLANRFEAQGHGVIAVIGSPAGDRGRKANYIYGTAKAGLHVYLQGLRNRLAKRGITVLTIKPGFVDTPMTAHLPKGPLFASSEKVGGDIWKAMKKRKDVIYTPWFWRYIMLIIKLIPERVFKRMSI